ncbi:carbohydrate ABC transporter permease [Paenibacillus qinlingensis]|uniref:Aldouronate transport system permease protein n=1 Tax=Paenibacillus qinlingensis TaxID=1837343 RepID=A0ABU1NYK0_9BACL|nr:carbohydrate ABC transporter permease [Paenibacillus qinlingensis]MDR6552141.1 putative aldouronate transport system permease protein [Paenibacillus qinlingensis]
MKDRTWGGRLFDITNITLLLLFAALAVLPFLYMVLGSFASPEEFAKRGMMLIPTKFSLDAYTYIFSTNTIVRSLFNTIFITVAGTFINLLFTVLMAYPLARKELLWRKPVMLMVIFSMLFSGGMIPTFLVVKMLGLMNSLWSLLIPGAISAFNLIILKNFLPEGIEESAKIDGCNDVGILFRIVLPLSLPAIATFSLFYAVGHWNSFFSAILYINDTTKWPIQVILRQVVIMAEGGIGDSSQVNEAFVIPPQSIKMAVITVSTLPILIVYPFLQRHFAKGVLLGSVKG